MIFQEALEVYLAVLTTLSKMFSKTTVLLLLLFSYHCSADQLSCRHSVESFDSPLNNRVLIGQVIKSLFTRGGILSCAHRCLSLPLCSSYNYQTSEATDYGRVCELNGGNEDDRQNLVERAGYVFARKRRNTEKVTPASLLLVVFSFIICSSCNSNFKGKQRKIKLTLCNAFITNERYVRHHESN